MNPVTTAEQFSVKTAVFEGPLDLLIELVEKRKLLINDISLAAVTDEYLQRVSDMQERSLPNTAQFVQLAATLLLIKSKSLLPVLELTKEEEESIEDLEERLRRYQLYRDAAQSIQERFGKTIMYESQYAPSPEPLFVPDAFCSTAALSEAIGRVLTELPKPTFAPKVTVERTMSLEEMIDSLKARIERQVRTKFSELRAQDPARKSVIIGFLAILELVKQGGVLVRQEMHFEDIEIELSNTDIPRYY